MTEILTVKLGPTNVYLIKTTKGYIQIDTGTKTALKKYLLFLKKNAIKSSDIKLIIITHAHSDHVGLLSKIKELTKAQILIHENDKDALSRGKQDEIKAISFTGKLILHLMPKAMHYFDPIKADVIVKDNFSLSKYGLEAKIIHTPGHTMGNISLLDTEGNAFVGCTAQGPPLRLKVGFPATAVDIESVVKSLKKLLNAGAKIFYVGHGKPIKAENIRMILEKR